MDAEWKGERRAAQIQDVALLLNPALLRRLHPLQEHIDNHTRPAAVQTVHEGQEEAVKHVPIGQGVGFLQII